MPSTPTPPGRTVAVLADDLTGSTDSVVQFREAGWTSYLLLSESVPDTGADLVATSRSLDSRPLPDAEAAARTREAVSERAAAGYRLYLKIDSTVRGSVAGQVRGALEAWKVQHPDALAVVCPAYPQMGRVIERGSMTVGGVPLAESPAGSDPVTPVRSSSLTDLLPGSVSVANQGSAQDLAAALTEAASTSSILVVDASTDEDLMRLAEAVETLGPRVVCAGSAGLARQLAQVWRAGAAPAPVGAHPSLGRGRIVVSVTSLNQVSAGQVAHLRTSLGERLEGHEFSVDELTDIEAVVARARRIVADAGAQTRVILVQPSAERSPDLGAADGARAVAGGMAAGVAAMVASEDVAALVLVGGDGAQSALQQICATAVQVDRQLSEGVPLGVVVGGPASGLPVVTKAGGFGTQTTLTDIIDSLTINEGL